MKRLAILLTTIIVSSLNMGFRSIPSVSPKLYPELDNFFKSVKTMPVADDHKRVLNYISDYILGSALGNKEENLVYGCPDNSFRSMAAQIFTQTLMNLYKYKKIKVFSCGTIKGAVDPEIINLLTGAGYKINKQDNGTIEVKYSDDLSPLLIATTKADDASIPKSNFFYVSLCSVDEQCPVLTGAAYNYSLGFKNPKSGDASAEFKQIAAEVYYASNKAYESYH